MTNLRPMTEAPRTGETIIGVRKQAKTPAIQATRHSNDARIGWKGKYWINRSSHGQYHQDADFEGWRPEATACGEHTP